MTNEHTLLAPQPQDWSTHRALSFHVAARLLAEHLGKSPRYWLNWLAQDRKRGEQAEIRCWVINGVEVYDERDIYKFLASQRPMKYAPQDWNWDATVEIDYAARGRLLVDIQPLSGKYRQRLTPAEARVIAAKLIRVADYCDQHRFSIAWGKMEPTVRVANEKPAVHDAEIDKLLRDLDPQPAGTRSVESRDRPCRSTRARKRRRTAGAGRGSRSAHG